MPQRPVTDSPAYGPLDPLDQHRGPVGRALPDAPDTPTADELRLPVQATPDRHPTVLATADEPPRPAQVDPAGGRPAGRTGGQSGGHSGSATQNLQLAALIEEAGFSHAGLARRVDQLGLEHGLDLRYDKTSVTRWLRGQQPRGATPALIAEVFTRRLGRRLTAQDLGLDACAPVYAGLEFAETPQEAVDIVASMWRKDNGPQSELRRIAFTPAGLVVPSRDWLIGRTDERVARDGSTLARPDPGSGAPSAGPPGPGAPGGSAAPPARGSAPGTSGTPGTGLGRAATPAGSATGAAPAAAGTPAGATAGPASGTAAGTTALGRVPTQSRRPPIAVEPPYHDPAREPRPALRVGRGDIAAIRAVGDLFRALDHAYGGGHARQALVRYLESEAEPMLRGRYGEQIGRALFGAVADLTRLAGWTSFDIAAHGLAQRYFVQALRLSQAAGDRALGGYVLVTMSQQAVHLGHGREAVQLARVAQQGVGGAVPPTVQALLHAAEARGHGLLGDVRSCTTALVRAERSLAAARAGDELPSWARFFDEAQLSDEFAHCYRDLQQWRTAAQHAEKSLRLRSPAYARSRIFCRLVLATARLGMGDLDEACGMATDALRAAGEMRSARSLEYVRDFHRRLTPYRGSPVARAFEETVRQAGVI
ncbi:regulator [Streptomyces sp. BE303]|uniref:regulator n=1 Tax=Streptomyces sp. BE303 TaxID=3002528 RepID=UPI002E796774|nr:regulator [Streptomyces sp. BE303]MED7950996.1 regulator [Streptomyces sp. BE303]